MIAPLDIGPLGPTGIETTRLGLGAGALGGHLWKVTPEQAVETVVRTYELGVRHADTSPLYGDSENRIGTALRGHEFPGLTISTKVGTHPDRAYSYTGEDLRWSLDNSLRLLGRESVDIVLIHDPPSADPLFKAGDGFDAVDRFKREGKCRAVGLGVRDHAIHRAAIEAGRVDVILTWGEYHLAGRTAGPLITEAHEAGVAVVLGSPAMQGLLAIGNPVETLELRDYTLMYPDAEIQRAIEWWGWCREREVGLRHLNMQFVLANPHVDMVLTGTKYASEIEANVPEALTPVPDDVWTEALELIARQDEQGAAG